MTGFSEDPAPFAARLDKAAFFAWIQAQDGGRFELKDGHIVMHAGSTRRHWQIASRIVWLLNQAFDPHVWTVGSADFAVEIGEDIRYPDVLVEAADASPPEAMSTTRAVLLAEVLSPSSVSRDMNLKLAEYTSLASLQCYIVASQDEPIVWVWQRDEETGVFPALPQEIRGLEGRIDMRGLGISLPLAEIYRGLVQTKSP